MSTTELPNFDKLTPVLQIMHISDMHLVDLAFDPPRKISSGVRRLLQRLDSFRDIAPFMSDEQWEQFVAKGAALQDRLEWGQYGHDEGAIDALERWCKLELCGDDEWDSVPTWLIDTGDQSTFGDDPSLDYGLRVLQTLSSSLGSNVPYLRIHGNHDAWPEKQPILALTKRHLIRQHRDKLRQRHFPDDYPCPTNLSYNIPDTLHNISVFSLNSVVHTVRNNFFGRGDIKEDKYWKKGKSKADEGIQLSELEKLAELTLSGDREAGLRIVLSHHPIHLRYNRIRDHIYSWPISLKNAGMLTRELARVRDALCNKPLAHLILSGHTHMLYPEQGRLSEFKKLDDTSPYKCPHQFVIGTASQLNSLSGSELRKPLTYDELRMFDKVYSNQLQILRIYKTDTTAEDRIIYIERVVAGRVTNQDDFGLCQNVLNSENPNMSEWVSVSY